MRVLLVAGMCIPLAMVAAGRAAAQDTDEYVRVCDAYGSGFFYIPGTETCLRIGGGLAYSRIQNPSSIGAGTTVIGTSEAFTFASPGWIDRWGGDLTWEYGLGSDAFGTRFVDDYYGYIFGNASFATGRERARGSSVVGTAGVTQVGLTFGQPHMTYGTGVGSTTNGIGVAGWSKLDNSWFLGSFGTGKTFLDEEMDEDDIEDFYFDLRVGGYVEYIGYSGRGRARITQNGATLAGFYQNYNYNSGDTYVGAIIGADMYFHPTNGLRLTLGAELRPAYHWGHATLTMETGVGGGNVVNENFNFSHNGLTLGGTLKAGADYSWGNGWSVGVNYQWSIVPGVTATMKPAGPAFQPVTSGSQAVQRHELVLRAARAFIP